MKLFHALLGISLFTLVLTTCEKEKDIPPKSDTEDKDTLTNHPDSLSNNPDPNEDSLIIISIPHDIHIQAHAGEKVFWNTQTNSQFIPRGVNYFHIISTGTGLQDRFFGIGVFNEEETRQIFQKLKSMGYNVVRFFMDSCNDGPTCIGNPGGKGLNMDYIDNIVRTLEIAKEEGIYLLLTSNDLPDSGGYWDISNQGANDQFEGYRNAHYLTSKGVESAQLYWNDLMKALYEKEAPFEAVFAWSILNEQWYFRFDPPFSLTSGTVTCANGKTYNMASSADKKAMAQESIMLYIDSVKAVIKFYDPEALVTMGFFAPDHPNPFRIGDFKYVETAELLNQANLDFFDFHAYPGWESLEELAENFGMMGYSDKPIIMGEFGAFTSIYSTVDYGQEAVQAWMAQSCELGWNGWLYWGLLHPPEAIGDATWSFFDGDSQILKGLAPVNYPDACDPELLPPENIAWGKTVTASNYISGEEPENAVDGNLETQWGSGGHPPQWIEIDLEGEFNIGTIRLYVAQYPEGNTEHTLEGKTAGGSLESIYTFSGNTAGGDILEYSLTSDNTYQFLRITTTSGPSWVSWKEVEVFEK